MKIRIIGTSIKSYLKNISIIMDSNVKKFYLNEVGLVWNIIDKETKKKIISFSSDSTAIQNIEMFEALGFVSNKAGEITLNIDSKNDFDEKIMESVIEIHENKKIQHIRNSILLGISHYKNPFEKKDITLMKINQERGELSIEKLDRLISNYEKNLIDSNEVWLIKIRRVLYEQIDKEF